MAWDPWEATIGGLIMVSKWMDDCMSVSCQPPRRPQDVLNGTGETFLLLWVCFFVFLGKIPTLKNALLRQVSLVLIISQLGKAI